MAKKKSAKTVAKSTALTFVRFIMLFITQIITVIILFIIEKILFPRLGTTTIYTYIYKPLITWFIILIHTIIVRYT